MRHLNFITKLLSLLALLGVLYYYQTVAVQRAAAVEENQAAIAEVEAYNQEILREQLEAERAQAEQETEEETSGNYLDGVYLGEGTGFGGPIAVSVTVEDGVIAHIEVTAHDGEDPAYYVLAESVLDAVLETQGTEVDTVSGATFSSGGLLEAVGRALEQAVK